ncbi:MAG: tryptophan--tRNA ligase [Candidatus Omnitrophota bacterium]|nr:MAG: tryptophan--tRNA ligase [Candidatus Omnitrophota bacterium]
MKKKKIVLSGMRPTDKLHIGHWVGALSNWVSLQNEYSCFFMVADWHALMSEYKDSSRIGKFAFDNVCDWLVYGVDPQKSIIFVQSDVNQHLELFLTLSLITPLGWLFRCPTFKEQMKQLKDKEINTYAFLGYPVLQASDILLYRANYVPVGQDQLPHLELCREIVRRFHTLYKNGVFVEPQPLLTSTSRLLGLDGRKMSKSYDNFISLDEEDRTLERKVLSMFTDPQRQKKADPGHPQNCNVYTYYSVFQPQMKDEVEDWCRNAKRGCVECKKILAGILREFIAPKREKKRGFLKKKDYIYDILREGKAKAEKVASETLQEAKRTMKLL